MSIPDLPTIPEVSGQSKSGIKYHILGTVQQTLAVELQPNQVVYSDAGAMSWMTSTVTMSTKAGGGLGGMLKRAVSGATVFIIDFAATGAPGQVSFSTDFPGKVLAGRAGGRAVGDHAQARLPVRREECRAGCLLYPQAGGGFLRRGRLHPAEADRTRHGLCRTGWGCGGI